VTPNFIVLHANGVSVRGGYVEMRIRIRIEAGKKLWKIVKPCQCCTTTSQTSVRIAVRRTGSK